MFSDEINIDFISLTPELLDVLEKPYAAKGQLPPWFIKTERYINGVKNIDQFNDPNSTIKKCMPVVDMMTAGYHLPLHCDVWVENSVEKNISFKWSWDHDDVLTIQKPEQHDTYPIPDGFYSSVFKYINPWIVKTPPGWSSLFLHPSHHNELPFHSLSALVDTDEYPSPVNFPFFLRKGFNGLIPKGTPIIQVIPFKRETFKASFSWDKGSLLKKAWTKAHSVFFERYQRFFRCHKEFGEVTKKESKCPFGFGN